MSLNGIIEISKKKACKKLKDFIKVLTMMLKLVLNCIIFQY